MAADSGGAALLYAGGQGTAVSWLLFWMSWLRHLVACANPMPPFAAALVRLDHTGATISVKGRLWWHGNADGATDLKTEEGVLGARVDVLPWPYTSSTRGSGHDGMHICIQ